MNQEEAEKKMLEAWAGFVKESELLPGNFPSPALGRAWIRSIIAAIEQEREACAKIADDSAAIAANNARFGDRDIYENRADEARTIASWIRARSSEGNK